MTESVYDGAQTAADILYGYRSYLRAEMVNLTNKEIEDLIKKLEEYNIVKIERDALCCDPSPSRRSRVEPFLTNQISQHLDYLEFLLEKAGVLKDRAKNHYTKHDWQHMR